MRDSWAKCLALCALLAVCCAVFAGTAAAKAGFPNHHQVQALYVIDHGGGNPPNAAALTIYSQTFERVLAGCAITPDDLVMTALNLAEQASAIGARVVTGLTILKAIARRIAWTGKSIKGCGYIYNLAEAYSEVGQP